MRLGNIDTPLEWIIVVFLSISALGHAINIVLTLRRVRRRQELQEGEEEK